MESVSKYINPCNWSNVYFCDKKKYVLNIAGNNQGYVDIKNNELTANITGLLCSTDNSILNRKISIFDINHKAKKTDIISIDVADNIKRYVLSPNNKYLAIIDDCNKLILFVLSENSYKSLLINFQEYEC